MVLRKDELEVQLKNENELIKSGVLREENPLDQSKEFADFLEACRRGDLKTCQELISGGVNINGKDNFDYTPLIVASLCGHFELVQFLLEEGALAERNTFQGERCIYNALNDRIRNLLLRYDYSKQTDPLQPWSSHITSLLSRQTPSTSDITLAAATQSFQLHKFLLSARTPYFQRKLEDAPTTTAWKLPASIPAESYRTVLRYLYLGDIPKELVDQRGGNSGVTEEEVLTGVDKISKQLEVEHLWEAILSGNDRRLARQRYQDEVQRAQGQVERFFEERILAHKVVVETRRVGEVRWPHGNAIFADCLLRADEPLEEDEEDGDGTATTTANGGSEAESDFTGGIPIGPFVLTSSDDNAEKRPGKTRKIQRSVLYPAHKAMLIRSPYFETMFSSEFREAHDAEHLHVIAVDCLPEVLEIILAFLYTEKVDCPLDLALDVLYAADMLFLDKLKTKAAVAISTLGSGTANALVDRTHNGGGGNNNSNSTANGAGKVAIQGQDGDGEAEVEMEPVNIYDVIHAAWDLRVQRLEEFAARYLAYRLEDYIDDEDFAALIRESADRLRARQETDTIELLDDIRYYLSERFRLRFEDAGLDEMLDDEGELAPDVVEALAAARDDAGDGAGPSDGPKVLPESTEKEKSVESRAVGEDDGGGGVTTLDGEVAEDEFASDAINYQILLGKIDAMLDRLKLDA